MALEEYFNQDRIRVQRLSTEIPEKGELNSRRLFENLKRTALYDQFDKQWNTVIDENQQTVSTSRISSVQLLGILVESLFDRTKAKISLEHLKQTGFYDSQRNQWNNSMSKDGQVESNSRTSFDQLMGIFLESHFDKAASRKHYEDLKQTPLYDKERKAWNYFMLEDQMSTSSAELASEQLLGVIVEAVFDPQAAGEIYDRLKKDIHWNRTYHCWDNDTLKIESLPQLLGVLAESAFDKNSARKLFKDLKDSSLFDQKTEQWIFAIDYNRQPHETERTTTTQLLGIYLEHILSEENSPRQSNDSPVPLVKKF